jgi:uncharacterized membrane protein
MDGALFALTLVTALGCGAMGGVFFAAACVALTIAALIWLDEPYAGYLLAGSAIYLLGTIALTIGYHVPRNEALAKVEPDSVDAAGHWSGYVADWTRWNHVRGAAALAAAGVFTAALAV